MRKKVNMKRYGLYLIRWQLSTPILAGVLIVLAGMGKLTGTVIANFIGGLIFFWVDMFIFTSKNLSVQWEVKDAMVCTDCGRETRGYRIVRAAEYDRSEVPNPEYRCEACSSKKTEDLRLRGIGV
ncbi:MAG TPA: hypothetical protein VMT62_11380 [Syntrophorhabdaceae bacterium]|nr:hypothetical protein [Syntrophorhabdaceae bacterium]